MVALQNFISHILTHWQHVQHICLSGERGGEGGEGGVEREREREGGREGGRGDADE